MVTLRLGSWTGYLTILLALFFAPMMLAQDLGSRPDTPEPKTGQVPTSLLKKTTEIPTKEKDEPILEVVANLSELATRLLDFARVSGCFGKDCTILVTNFSLPNGQTSQYGMQLADELSLEMIAQQSQFPIVDRNLLQNILTKDRIPAKSIQGGVLHFLGAALNARFVVIGTTTKTGDDAVQLSAEIFDLTDKDWKGYSAAVNLPAQKATNAMSPSEPFGPLQPLAPYSESPMHCTVMTNPAYAEEARKFRVDGTIDLEGVVTTEGRVQQVRIVQGLPGGLNEQAIAAAEKWRCDAFLTDNPPIARVIKFQINFRLY